MYDLLILGGGVAGVEAAVRASRFGWKVALFEKQAPGGNGPNCGSLPVKALLHSVNIYQIAQHSRYGHTTAQSGFDIGAAVARKNSIARRLMLETRQRIDDANVHLIQAHARLTGIKDGVVEICANEQYYTGKRLLIATGSVPVAPSVPGAEEALESGFAKFAHQIGASSVVPKAVCITGASALSLELAQIYQAAGSAVFILAPEGQGSFLPDTGYSQYIENELCTNGIEIVYNAVLTRVESSGVVYERDSAELAAACQMVIFCDERKPNMRGFGLESITPKLYAGGIDIDNNMRTSVENVWAAGDCTGKCMLAHVASRQAEVAVNDMLGNKDAMRYDNIPYVCYTRPAAASVGMTVENALACGADAWAVELPLHYLHRFQIDNIRAPGLAKLVLNGDKAVGFHMVGDGAPELCAAALMLIESGTPLREMRGLMFAHITMGEIFTLLIEEAVYRMERTKR